MGTRPARSMMAALGCLERAAEDNGAEDNGAEDNGAEDNGAEDNGAEDNGAEDNGAEDNGTEDNGAEDNGSESEGPPGGARLVWCRPWPLGGLDSVWPLEARLDEGSQSMPRGGPGSANPERVFGGRIRAGASELWGAEVPTLASRRLA